jgi:hypothetical protein
VGEKPVTTRVGPKRAWVGGAAVPSAAAAAGVVVAGLVPFKGRHRGPCAVRFEGLMSSTEPMGGVELQSMGPGPLHTVRKKPCCGCSTTALTAPRPAMRVQEPSGTRGTRALKTAWGVVAQAGSECVEMRPTVGTSVRKGRPA